MLIYFGADHRGFELKEELKSFIQGLGYEVADMGATDKNPSDDYPNYAAAVAEKVSRQSDQARGVLVCGSGAGMDIVANKFKGVRATIGLSSDQVFDARSHDDLNVLVLASDFTSTDTARNMLKVFLDTPMSTEERHTRRLTEIAELEERR